MTALTGSLRWSRLSVKGVVGAAAVALAVSSCSGSATPATEASVASSTSTSSAASQRIPGATAPTTEASTSSSEQTQAKANESEGQEGAVTEAGAQDAATSEQEGSAEATGSAPDYADDAGRSIKEYEYPHDPEPAASVVATLCNLNRQYFEDLQPTTAGKPAVDETLSMAVLGLSDLLDYWDGLRPHYPEVGVDIDTAWAIRDSWDEALLNMENGETAAAQEAMAHAQELIEQLPAGSLDACINNAPEEG